MNSLPLPTQANAALIEQAYQSWLENPDSVDPTWRAFFQGFKLGYAGEPLGGPAAQGVSIIDGLKQSHVHYLISNYRAIGHLEAHLDPLSAPPPAHPKLGLDYYKLSEADLDTSFDVGTYLGGGQMKLRDVIGSLRETYCGTVGVEYTHIQDLDVRFWLQEKMESVRNQPAFTRKQKLRILRRVHKAELFEKFLHTKYVGQKRFSLEGGETIIAALDSLIEHCPQVGVEEIVMGMAHRGRLNVLTSIMRKSFDELFAQFSENYIPDTVGGDGDVKYHLGYTASLKTTTGGEVDVRLVANPSHLEIVDAVVEGKARARQRIRGDIERTCVMPVLIHGDAAFAGQGIVAETMNFSQLAGYRTGGTVHFVINNQIGFTTDPSDARSTRYCTDVAKMIEAPVFHVNGDDPEAVCMVAQLALEFRVRFHRDVVIDMYCYRKHGHNESDEPAFTQPLLYRKISKHPQVSAILTRKLTEAGAITAEEGEAIKTEYTQALETHLEKTKAGEGGRSERRKARRDTVAQQMTRELSAPAARFQPSFDFEPVPTHASMEDVADIARALSTVPEGFSPNGKIKRLLDQRAAAIAKGEGIDWGLGEALSIGSLLLDGIHVRLSGQDCQRGTFSHRHAVLHDMETHETHISLRHIRDDQAMFCVYNSLLSEAAVLGFDYGYATYHEKMLCIWEAQFGDFANGAQVIIDQFIASGESKWQQTCDLVLLLPHGYEGQGPEHSSARLERFLSLCAEDNIQVANPTTPAQYFHLLRRQMKRKFRKPLVIMSPKSLLRNPAATSRLDEFTSGHFHEILDDETFIASPVAPPTGDDGSAAKVVLRTSSGDAQKMEADTARRLILCSGKVYYDLCDYRAKNGITDAAIVRMEQLYPLNVDRLAAVAARYPKARLIWCQEEPHNMGAWNYIAPLIEAVTGRPPHYAGRGPGASPAVGSLALHHIELEAFLNAAFTV